LSARKAVIDHRLDNARYNETQSRHRQQYEKCRQYLPKIWFEEDFYSK